MPGPWRPGAYMNQSPERPKTLARIRNFSGLGQGSAEGRAAGGLRVRGRKGQFIRLGSHSTSAGKMIMSAMTTRFSPTNGRAAR